MTDIRHNITNTMLAGNRDPAEDLNRLVEIMVVRGVEMETNDKGHTTEDIEAVSLS